MSTGRPDMDMTAKTGARPGSASGVVKSYDPTRNPFGGYITEGVTGFDVFVHKSAVEQAGLDKLEAGQNFSFEIVEDGFGGFKAEQLVAIE